MQAMILAAGFGTRLLPFTKIYPKPLFPLLGDPLLLLTIRHLQAAGFDHIIVNCHYMREQIVSALAGMEGVVIQEEEAVLGTGGGLRMAMANLRDEPLLVTNGDIYHSVDYQELYSSHQTNPAAVTMAMHDYPRFNNVSVQGSSVTGFDDPKGENNLAFTGLHVLDPEVLGKIPVALEYSIIDRYRGVLEEGQGITALRVDGCCWTDMGTVADYLALHGRLLKREIPLWPEFSVLPDTPFFVDDSVEKEALSFADWVCVGRVKLAGDVYLQRCVVWDGAEVEAGAEFFDVLIV